MSDRQTETWELAGLRLESRLLLGTARYPSRQVLLDALAASGTPRLTLSDNGEANVSMPFAFPFYGTPYTDLRVANNGAILLGVTTGDVFAGNVCPLPTTLGSASAGGFWSTSRG